jgi:RNAse (barnase) inhibitor barstar
MEQYGREVVKGLVEEYLKAYPPDEDYEFFAATIVEDDLVLYGYNRDGVWDTLAGEGLDKNLEVEFFHFRKDEVR